MNYEIEDALALQEAMSIHRRSSLMKVTGWTPSQLDGEDELELEKHMTWLNLLAGIEHEERELAKSRQARNVSPRRRR